MIRIIMLDATDTQNRKLEVLEINTLRLILNKLSRYITNDQLYVECQERIIKKIILHQTRNLFQNKLRIGPFARNSGAMNRENTNFRKIHRLMSSLMLSSEAKERRTSAWRLKTKRLGQNRSLISFLLSLNLAKSYFVILKLLMQKCT